MKLLNKIINSFYVPREEHEYALSEFIKYLISYNDAIGIPPSPVVFKQLINNIHEDNIERCMYLIWTTINYSKIKDNHAYLRHYDDKKLSFLRNCLEFVKKQMNNKYQYHNINHIYSVIENMTIIMILGMDKDIDNQVKNIPNMETIFTLFLSAIFHDIIYAYGIGDGDNEKLSCKMMESYVTKNFSVDFENELGIFDETDQEIIMNRIIHNASKSIMATVPSQRSFLGKSKYREILADADVFGSFINSQLTEAETNKIIQEVASYSPVNFLKDQAVSEIAANFVIKVMPMGFVTPYGKNFQGAFLRLQKEFLDPKYVPKIILEGV